MSYGLGEILRWFPSTVLSECLGVCRGGMSETVGTRIYDIWPGYCAGVAQKMGRTGPDTEVESLTMPCATGSGSCKVEGSLVFSTRFLKNGGR